MCKKKQELDLSVLDEIFFWMNVTDKICTK
jgi:hypothetical protein